MLVGLYFSYDYNLLNVVWNTLAKYLTKECPSARLLVPLSDHCILKTNSLFLIEVMFEAILALGD